MGKDKTIFLTGATGFLGSYLLRDLVYSDITNISQILVLVRAKNQKEGEEKITASLKEIVPVSKLKEILKLINVILGDISKEFLGISESTYFKLIKNVNTIYHSAALCDFMVPWDIIKKNNVNGTKNVLEFARLCCKSNQLKGLHLVSTVAVGGDKKGVLYENELDVGQKFNNTYERSKFEAEKLATEYRNQGIPINIYRPAIIVGDSLNGYTNNFKMVYQPLHFFSCNIFNQIPAEQNTQYSFSPVDLVSKAIVKISLTDGITNKCFNIFNPNKLSLNLFLEKASQYFGFNKPELIPLPKFDFGQYSELSYKLIKPYIPYFNYNVWFDSTNTNEVLNNSIKWPSANEEFLSNIFSFCVKKRFIKRVIK